MLQLWFTGIVHVSQTDSIDSSRNTYWSLGTSPLSWLLSSSFLASFGRSELSGCGRKIPKGSETIVLYLIDNSQLRNWEAMNIQDFNELKMNIRFMHNTSTYCVVVYVISAILHNVCRYFVGIIFQNPDPLHRITLRETAVGAGAAEPADVTHLAERQGENRGMMKNWMCSYFQLFVVTYYTFIPCFFLSVISRSLIIVHRRNCSHRSSNYTNSSWN